MNKKMILALLFLLAICIAPVAGESANTDKDAKPNVANATQARLGIGVSPLPEVLAAHLPGVISKERGVLVSDVIKGSPADKVGLKKYDVLVSYADQDLYSPEQLMKRVRNDQPGSTVAIQYVREGKLEKAEVKLGEEKAKEPAYFKLPEFGSTFKFPWSQLRPNFWTEAEDAGNEGTEWTVFESLKMNKQVDGTYSVRITYKDKSGKSIEREFKGTRQEIREAVSADDDLPESRKNQMMRMLDDRGQLSPMDGEIPRLFNWNRELFQWPNADF